jgi:2-polyprenyl-3-methyl-5-hydroxy-6-metoxy-1,4-benzoquinol methylase
MAATKRRATAKSGSVVGYYDAAAEGYFQQYQKDNLASGKKYPQNYYRLQWLVQRLATSGARSVYEVGTGEGTPLATLSRMGFEVAGCDISENMVKHTRQRLKEAGADPQRVHWGDIEDSMSVADQLSRGRHDALFAFGVMPHVRNDGLVLRNMRMFVKTGGRVYIEFRNKLFSLFTFNRYTKEFILGDLLADVAADVKEAVAKELDSRVALNQPPAREDASGVSYDLIHAKFHNPFEVPELLRENGFINCKLHWYHYHAAPPMLDKKLGKRVWEEAAKLEHRPDDWRGNFLCSAMVAEAEAGPDAAVR